MITEQERRAIEMQHERGRVAKSNRFVLARTLDGGLEAHFFDVQSLPTGARLAAVGSFQLSAADAKELQALLNSQMNN